MFDVDIHSAPMYYRAPVVSDDWRLRTTHRNRRYAVRNFHRPRIHEKRGDHRYWVICVAIISTLNCGLLYI
jgi:hypothetical protein